MFQMDLKTQIEILHESMHTRDNDEDERKNRSEEDERNFCREKKKYDLLTHI